MITQTAPSSSYKPWLVNVPDRIGRAFTALVSVIIVALFGWLGETGADGGFIKDIWASLKTASPPVAMGAAFLLYIVWREWQKDRTEHQIRTAEFSTGMNTAARLREADKQEKRLLRERISKMEQDARKRKRRS